MAYVFLIHAEHLMKTMNVLSVITEEMESFGRHKKTIAQFSALTLIVSCQETTAEFLAITDSIQMLIMLSVCLVKTDAKFAQMI